MNKTGWDKCDAFNPKDNIRFAFYYWVEQVLDVNLDIALEVGGGIQHRTSDLGYKYGPSKVKSSIRKSKGSFSKAVKRLHFADERVENLGDYTFWFEQLYGSKIRKMISNKYYPGVILEDFAEATASKLDQLNRYLLDIMPK